MNLSLRYFNRASTSKSFANPRCAAAIRSSAPAILASSNALAKALSASSASPSAAAPVLARWYAWPACTHTLASCSSAGDSWRASDSASCRCCSAAARAAGPSSNCAMNMLPCARHRRALVSPKALGRGRSGRSGCGAVLSAVFREPAAQLAAPSSPLALLPTTSASILTAASTASASLPAFASVSAAVSPSSSALSSSAHASSACCGRRIRRSAAPARLRAPARMPKSPSFSPAAAALDSSGTAACTSPTSCSRQPASSSAAPCSGSSTLSVAASISARSSTRILSTSPRHLYASAAMECGLMAPGPPSRRACISAGLRPMSASLGFFWPRKARASRHDRESRSSRSSNPDANATPSSRCSMASSNSPQRINLSTSGSTSCLMRRSSSCFTRYSPASLSAGVIGGAEAGVWPGPEPAG
mmetsp:Transcript_36578/g.58756  ORF Transcript_36578/g.58756 Transcript_36578/m.58756 type:complete len:419 (-) Transcript_36578:81-1337(-)